MTWEELEKVMLTKEVFIGSGSQNKYYEGLGYTKQKVDGKTGFLVNPKDLPKGSNKRVEIACKNCGNIISSAFNNLTRVSSKGLCKNCQNTKNLNQTKIEIGKTYNRLTVLKDTGRRSESQGHIFYECRCSCGTITEVRSDALIDGSTKSCGCLAREKSKENIEKYNRSIGYRMRCDYTDEENAEFDREHLNFYQDKHWIKTRNLIRKRDNYTCQISGAKENLIVHHIIPRKVAPELCFELSSLILIEHDLHSKYHMNNKIINKDTLCEYFDIKL